MPGERPPGAPREAASAHVAEAALADRGEQRRQQRQARSEAHEHARARDEPQLGDADERRRHERVKARGGRHGADHERCADAADRVADRRLAAGAFEHAFLEAQIDVQNEVDAEPDVEHGERDREQVELADRDGRERGRADEPDDERHERDREQAQRPQRPVEHERDHRERRERRDAGSAAHADHLLVLHRDRAREAHLDAAVEARELRVDDLAQPSNGLATRLHPREVQHGAQDDETPRAAVPGGADEAPPGQRGHVGAAGRGVERLGELGVQRRELGAGRRAVLDRSPHDLDRAGAVEAAAEQTEQRLRGD